MAKGNLQLEPLPFHAADHFFKKPKFGTTLNETKVRNSDLSLHLSGMSIHRKKRL